MRHWSPGPAALHRPLAILILLAAVSAAVAHADDPKACCRIIRVNTEKGTAWLRNPRNGAVAQIRLGEADGDRFKIGDRLDPDASTLNGTKLEHRYAMVLPEIEAMNAHIIRARGAEMAAEMDATKTVYRIYALKFGRVLSSVKPGEPIYIDEAERWAYIRVEGYGKVKPSVWAFKLD
jgi:hypothetical protein